jgi:transposase-like protein
LRAEHGLVADVTIFQWVQRFTPLLIDAARPCRHTPVSRWFTEETYVKVAGRWIQLYRAIDQFGQVIDVLASEKRDLAAARRYVTQALSHGCRPIEVTTDRTAADPRVLDEHIPAAHHADARYANNLIEADRGRLKARLRPIWAETAPLRPGDRLRGRATSRPDRPGRRDRRDGSACLTNDRVAARAGPSDDRSMADRLGEEPL